ncbi:hypothetical protein STEG23_016041, partial [Scotinomys teguina]
MKRGRCRSYRYKWIKDLDMKPVILTLLEEKVGNILECIGTEEPFLNSTTSAQIMRTTIDKWDLMKLKSF